MKIIEEVDGLQQYVIPFDDVELTKNTDSHQNNHIRWDVL